MGRTDVGKIKIQRARRDLGVESSVTTATFPTYPTYGLRPAPKSPSSARVSAEIHYAFVFIVGLKSAYAVAHSTHI